MVRAQSTYTQAHKRYYDLRIKPHRQKKIGLDIYSCPFCGMMNNLKRLRNPELHLKKISIREGCNWFSPEEYSIIYHNPELQVFIYEKWKVFMKDTCNKTLEFLRWAIKYGLITKERIILEFDLKIIKKSQTLENAKSLTNQPFIFSLVRGLSSIEKSHTLRNSKLIKSAGGILNG